MSKSRQARFKYIEPIGTPSGSGSFVDGAKNKAHEFVCIESCWFLDRCHCVLLTGSRTGCESRAHRKGNFPVPLPGLHLIFTKVKARGIRGPLTLGYLQRWNYRRDYWVKFIDSVGMHALVGTVRLTRALGGSARITNARLQVDRLMGIVGVYRLLMRSPVTKTDGAA